MTETCPICYNEFDNQDMIVLDICRHKFCKVCLWRYVTDQIDEFDDTIQCPDKDCHFVIDNNEIKDILHNDEETLIKYIKLINIDPNTQHTRCIECGSVNKKKEDNNEVYCENCYSLYCSVCNEYHDNFDYCPNESVIKKSLDEISEALGDVKVKLCPICKIVIYKEEGCSSMRCKYCKTKFCWHCLQTNSQISKQKTHICPDFYQYYETESEEEYVDGYDTD